MGADNQGINGIASALATSQSQGLSIQIGTINVNGALDTVGMADNANSVLDHVIGNNAIAAGIATSQSSGSIGPATGGAAISTAISGGFSLSAVGPDGLAIGAASGFGSGAGVAIKTTPGGGVPAAVVAGAGFESYSESGSTANLVVDERFSQSLEGRLEATISKNIILQSGHTFFAAGHIGGFVRTSIGSSDVNVQLLGQNLSFSTSHDSPQFGLYAGGEINYRISKNVTLSGGAEFTASNTRSIGANFRGGFRVAF